MGAERMENVGLDVALIQFYRCTSLTELLDEAAKSCTDIGFPFISLTWTPAAGSTVHMLNNHITVWNNYTDALGADGPSLSLEFEKSIAIALQRAKADTKACQRWKTEQRNPFQIVADAPSNHYLSDYQRQLPLAFKQPAWRDFFSAPLCRERDRALMFVAKTQATISEQMKSQILRTLDTFANAYRYLHIKALHHAYSDNESASDTALSRREVECLRWLASGKTLFEAATILGISERTMRFHIANARERLGVATTVQAIVAAAFAYGFDPHDGRRSIYPTRSAMG